MKPIKIKQGKVDIPFKSKEEAERYNFLLELQDKGRVTGLQRNVNFILIEPVYKKKTVKRVLKTKVKTEKKMVCAKGGINLTVDFVYRNKRGRLIVEMVKKKRDYKDPTYVLKKKLIYYLHRIDIVEN